MGKNSQNTTAAHTWWREKMLVSKIVKIQKVVLILKTVIQKKALEIRRQHTPGGEKEHISKNTWRRENIRFLMCKK